MDQRSKITEIGNPGLNTFEPKKQMIIPQAMECLLLHDQAAFKRES